MSHNDWLPTLAAIAGEPKLTEKLLKGYKTSGPQAQKYKTHLDGYDQSTFLRTVSGTVGHNKGVKSARKQFFYTDDDGLLVGFRYGDYKFVFAEQRMPGTMGVWAEPFTKLRRLLIFDAAKAQMVGAGAHFAFPASAHHVARAILIGA